MFSLWRKARRENSAASRLLGTTSLRFALHGWQRSKSRNSGAKLQGGYLDQRLIENLEAPGIQGLMKLGLYHQRTVGPVLHARLIVNDLTTTLIFPRMHGGV
ncbi:hypothetical protein [Thiolapillus sp.]|uniref:hypothetical protein n=1 Tax=Thiolapillus sp. TaxID=2017437 RepID=UPI003AF8D0E7